MNIYIYIYMILILLGWILDHQIQWLIENDTRVIQFFYLD